MGSLEMYDCNTCIQLTAIVNNTCIKKCTRIVTPSPQKLNSIDYDYFSVLLWSFNEIVFLFKES
jgi:hypothetical protein